MTFAAVAADLSVIIEALGTSAAEVARTLTAQRIHGVRHTSRFMNPICRYIEAALSLEPLTVDLPKQDTIRIALPDGTKLEARLRRPVMQFLEAFNRGAYPEIDVPPSGE